MLRDDQGFQFGGIQSPSRLGRTRFALLIAAILCALSLQHDEIPHQKISKNFLLTLPFADRSCAPDAANRFLLAAWTTGPVSVPLFRWSLAAR